MNDSLKKTVNIVGSVTKLAAYLGVSRAAVSQWSLSGRRVPAEHCPAIERLTNGKVRCEELNDRVDWTYLRNPTLAASPSPPGADKESTPARRAGAGASEAASAPVAA